MQSQSSIAMREETIDGTGGQLFIRHWPAQGRPTASLVICHGFNSHSGHYARAASVFAQRGFAVTALDLRGRGQSDGERFYVTSFDDYVSDLSLVIELAKSNAPNLPVFVLGHSAGGVTAAIYALDNQDKVAGFICESFAFRLPAPTIALKALQAAAHLLPHARVVRLKTADFSRDPAWRAHMQSDPLIRGEAQPLQSISALVRAAKRLDDEFERITIPVMIMHGTADRAANVEGSQQFWARAGSSDKTLKLYDGHFHDLLNDIGRDRVMNDIGNWIAERSQTAMNGSPAIETHSVAS